MKINSHTIMNKAKPVMCIAITFIILNLIIAEPAFAANTSGGDQVGFQAMTQMLQTMVTVLLLPLGILIAASKIIYLAIFVGIMGTDPLDLSNGEDPSTQIKDNFWGFAKGLAWVAGIWVILQLALTVANMLAAALDANF